MHPGIFSSPGTLSIVFQYPTQTTHFCVALQMAEASLKLQLKLCGQVHFCLYLYECIIWITWQEWFSSDMFKCYTFCSTLSKNNTVWFQIYQSSYSGFFRETLSIHLLTLKDNIFSTYPTFLITFICSKIIHYAALKVILNILISVKSLIVSVNEQHCPFHTILLGIWATPPYFGTTSLVSQYQLKACI